MKYRVIVQPNAALEAADSAIWWAENRSTDQAARWYEELEKTLADLSVDAERNSLARENDRFLLTLRQRAFGIGRKPTHRAVFHIKGDAVHVIAIRHLAQHELSPDDL